MKTAIPNTATSSPIPAKASAAPSLRPQSGRLAQLASMMNQSPRVQAQLKLADEIQNSEPLQRQMALVAEINQKQGRVKPAMQMKKGAPVNDGAAPERETDLMGQHAFVVSEGETQPMPGVQGEVAQRVLRITSESGTFTYYLGADFKRDHIGTRENAIATLRRRYQEDKLTSPVTTVAELDGNHNAREVQPKSPYTFALAIDLEGYTASWDAKDEPVAVEAKSVVLSGYVKGKKKGLITHISASD